MKDWTWKTWLGLAAIFVLGGLLSGVARGLTVDVLNNNDKSQPYVEQIENPVTTTTLMLTLGEGAISIYIGAASNDPTLYNMEWNGFDVDYQNGGWYINGVFIGLAASEDSEFMAQGPPWLMNTVIMYQNDAIEAGAEIYTKR